MIWVARFAKGAHLPRVDRDAHAAHLDSPALPQEEEPVLARCWLTLSDASEVVSVLVGL